jgi:hypothetical protein
MAAPAMPKKLANEADLFATRVQQGDRDLVVVSRRGANNSL